jgi:multidrug resistance efflux pump
MTQISPNDVVPALRHQLVFSESPQGLGDGLLSVTNITNGEELRLRGFEYSLARMLDGHRTAREVVDAAEKLGLPLTLGGLEGFVKKLASFDLVRRDREPPTWPDDALSPFDARERWDEPTREKFRKALREGRKGHLEEATHALDDLLEHDPARHEARKLRARVEERQRAQATVSFPAVFRETERRWLDETQLSEGNTGWINGRGVVIFWMLIAVAAALTLGAAIVPIQRVVTAPAILLPIASTQVTAPRSGTIVNVPVTVGQWVKKGDVLFGYDVNGTLAALDLAIVRAERQRRELQSSQEAIAAPAQTRYDRAEARVDQAEEVLTQARIAAGDPFSDAVLAQQEALEEAIEDLQHAQIELDAREPERQLAALRRLEAEVVQLERELDESVVRAPQAGRIITLEVHPGDSVSKGSDAVRVDDSKQLRVVATIEDPENARVEPGQSVLLLQGQGQEIQTTVSRVQGPYVELVVDNPRFKLQPGIGRVEIQTAPQPLVQLR